MLVLLGFPAALLAMWMAASGAGPSSTAEVRMTADQVLALRSTVIARMVAIGGERTAEQTDFSGGGSSELTFRLPAARLEEALASLGEAGGSVQSQEIDLQEAARASEGVAADLDDLAGCLGEAARAGTDVGAVRDGIDRCGQRLAEVSGSLETTSPLVGDATLSVTIDRAASRSNALLVAGIGVLSVALAVTAFLTLRSLREQQVVDVADRVDLTEEADADLGRRWN